MKHRHTLMAALLVLPLTTASCGLLDVTDPTRIEESDLTNAASADLMRLNAVADLFNIMSAVASDVGHATDELVVNVQPLTSMWYTELMDRRLRSELEERINPGLGTVVPWRNLVSARHRAATAIPVIRNYAPTSVRDARIAEMFVVRGYATLQIAQDICPGFPLNEAVGGRVVAGRPLSNAEGFQAALAEFDSAVSYAGDSARIMNLGRLGRGRALIGLGRFADASGAVTQVPTSFVQHADQTSNRLFAAATSNPEFTVADRVGTNGLDFVSANDPRVAITYRGTGHFADLDVYVPAKYPTSTAPVMFASGIEARLIEAEGALHAGSGAWLSILNQLRSTAITPAMPPLEDPGTTAERVDLLFRERAFWLFLTGRRLGDMRRLVAHYGRQAETVFPTGSYYRGGMYGTATNLPFQWVAEAAHNPAITGCTD